MGVIISILFFGTIGIFVADIILYAMVKRKDKKMKDLESNVVHTVEDKQ